MIEITDRDAARDGMGCIIDRWDGEERQTGLDAEHDQRTELADSLIDYLISTGWRRQCKADAEIDQTLEGVPYDDQLMSESEAKHYATEGGTVLYNDEGKPYRACPGCSGPLSPGESHDGELCGKQGVEPTELEKASPAWAESSRRAAEQEAQFDAGVVKGQSMAKTEAAARANEREPEADCGDCGRSLTEDETRSHDCPGA